MVGWDADWNDRRLASAFFGASIHLAGGDLPLVRCTSQERLEAIFGTGSDVGPREVLWCSLHASKALEYGGPEKIMLMYKHEFLRDTFREVDADIGSNELLELKQDYPTVIPSEDGQKLWLTRLPIEDRRATSPYEWHTANGYQMRQWRR